MRRRARSLLLALVVSAPATAAALPSPGEVRAAYPASEAQLLDRHGVVLDSRRQNAEVRRSDWVPLSALSRPLLDTVIAVEDQRFWQHAGVDWWAIAAALRDTLRGYPRGASTLDMQLAALLDPTLRARRGGRKLWQKWRQAQAGRALAGAWSKPEILEAYLNLASYRGELAGIGAASQRLFGKAPAALDRTDALLLSAMLGQPNASPAALSARACRLAVRLPTPVACSALRARARDLSQGTVKASPNEAPQLAARLLRTGGETVSSTLDARVQTVAREALQRQLRELAPRHVSDGAVLVVDNASAEVLAYVGNGAPLSSARFVDGVRARRQAGSTLKPFLYELAIETRRLNAASILEDSPLSVVKAGGAYEPRNYSEAFRGRVSLRSALAGSLNVPAVRTLMLLNPERFVGHLRQLGFALAHDGEYYGEALALGSPEVSLWELVAAYRTLASGGVYAPLRVRPKEPLQATPALQPAASFIVGDLLADRASRSATFGLESPLALPFWAAVKTGTSKEMRDNWCIGYTSRYTVGVWVGNFDGTPMWEVSGLSGAAPIWAEVMQALHASEPGRPPLPPAGLERRAVRFADALEPPREEWFLGGTETAEVRPAPVDDTSARIVAPANGSILVLDPDIPPAHQRIFPTMSPPRAGLSWQMNGKPLATGRAWAPRPGRHQLTLVNAAGVVIDRAQFVVRGDDRLSPAPTE